MKNILALLCSLVFVAVAQAAKLHEVPVSNTVNVAWFLVVNTDGSNVARYALGDVTLTTAFNATNAHFQTKIADLLAYSLSKTNPLAVIDSAVSGYAGLKLLQRSNDWLNVAFFDYTGAEAFRFRAGLTNGHFDLFDVQNDRTVWRYNGTNAATTYFTPLAINYISTPSTVAVYDGARGLTNSTVTTTELGRLGGVTSSVQDQINALRAGEIRPTSFILGTNYMLATNVSTLFVDATHSNIVVTIPTNTALLDGQQWTLRVVKGTNLLDLRTLSPGFDKVAFHTNITLALGEGITITKLGTNFLSATTASGGPIGSVTAWFPHLAGAPKMSSLWRPCDGSLLNDPGSPFNGINLPVISDQRFIRFSPEANSGATGGTVTHTHMGTTGANSGNTQVDQNNDGSSVVVASDPHDHAFTTDAADHTPQYIDSVAIIRVK
jgi:hypothetical protein